MLMIRGYIIQDNRSDWTQCTLAVRRMGSITYVLFFGLDETMLETVFGCLEHVLDLIGCPFLVPLLVAETKGDFSRRNLEKCHRQINEFDPTAGYYIDDNNNEHHGATVPVGFDENIRRLTWTTGVIAWCKLMANIYQDILEFIEAAVKSDMQVIADPPPEVRVILSKINNLKQYMKEIESRCCYLQERREGYIQTVSHVYRSNAMVSSPVMTDNTQIYSLTAQKDNAENIRLADASVRMAEAGLRASADMKAIATDSKMVALATLQDSAAMRTISAVTTFFLPATFTAVCYSQTYLAYSARLGLITMISRQTLFSTTFFNFQNAGGSMVSKWIWLYWLITAILTALTNYGWYWSIRRKEKEINLRHQDDQRSVEVIGLAEQADTITAKS